VYITSGVTDIRGETGITVSINKETIVQPTYERIAARK
jgi:hypothetical protein